MAFRFDPSKDPGAELRRIAREQVRGIRKDLQGDDPRKAAHEARKRLKKLRALLRSVRQGLGKTYSKENKRFRDIGRLLAPMRDPTSLLEGLATLEQQSNQSFEAVAGGLRRRRERIEQEASKSEPFDRALRALEKASKSIRGWKLQGDAMPLDGITLSYERGLRAMRRAREHPVPETFHEWRKRVKYHRHHCRLLSQAWEAPLEARHDEAGRLADLLGEHHDLAELHLVLLPDPDAYGGRDAVQAVLERAGERCAALELDALELGAKMYAEKPKRFIRRLGRYRRVAGA